MDFSKTLFRCSAVGKLMVPAQNKEDRAAGRLGQTAKTFLMEYWIGQRTGRTKEVTTKYMEKGLNVEEDAITLYSRINKEFFKKNTERVENQFITGHPDMFKGEHIRKAEKGWDMKAAWDAFTFYPQALQPLADIYHWQGQGYMALTGAKTWTFVYCLIDTPEQLINDEKKKLAWKLGDYEGTSPAYLEAEKQIDKNHRFGDLPLDERIIETTIERNDADIERMYKNIIKAREHLNVIEGDFLRKKKTLTTEYKLAV